MSQEIVTESHNRPGNPAAVLSLITGLLFCIPGLGIVSIAAGAWGIHRVRATGEGQRPATFGLVLGVINIFWWSAILVGAYEQYQTHQLSEPAVKASTQIIRLLGGGNVAAARALCDDSINDVQLTDAAEQLEKWGLLLKVNDRYDGKLHSMADIEVHVALHYETVDKVWIGHWKTVEGAPRLTAFEFSDPPTTQPTAQPAK